MKINDIAQAAAVQPKASAPAQPAERPVADKVRAKGPDKVAEAVSIAQAASGPARAAKLAQLQALVRSGSYQPDAQKIADQILNAAQIDAALRTMLQ